MKYLTLALPYAMLMLAWQFVLRFVDSPLLDFISITVIFYMMWGAHMVFKVKKIPSQQDLHRVDFAGAFKNLYFMAWWPWFLKR